MLIPNFLLTEIVLLKDDKFLHIRNAQVSVTIFTILLECVLYSIEKLLHCRAGTSAVECRYSDATVELFLCIAQ